MNKGIRMTRTAAAVLAFLFMATQAIAQSWVQIEAQPNAPRALERAQTLSRTLSDISVFRTGTRWHAVVLGPFASEADANRRLAELRAQRLVPSDSFVADGRGFRERIFGESTQAAAVTPAKPAAPAPVLKPGEETAEDARRAERNLTREDRALLQTALKFAGFYNSVIDAAFGPGTRRAMSAWQEANGFESTGILTTLQRKDLIDGYNEVIASLNITPIVDEMAGIEIELPVALVGFDRYDAPFAHYEATTDFGAKVVLISLEGGLATLTAFYDLMQTLEIAPPDGERNLGRESFTIDAFNERIRSHIFARRAGDAVKGYALVWPQGDDKRYRMALDAMKASFRTTDAILPENASSGAQNIDLLSGLEIRRPVASQSGFYIEADGTVLTAAAAFDQCSQITLDGDVEAELAATDTALGVALLRPRQALAPLSVARLTSLEPRLQSDIAVSGYSFGGVLTAPTLSFGKLSDVKGLNGDDRLQRLSVVSEPGDAGGPVFDNAGAVLGMLLSRPTGARQLPGDVAFAVDANVLAQFLETSGVTPRTQDSGDLMPPEDLTTLATDLTVLVSCWN
jgi:peptidoglycan hydrolase-like protein with peptidoglycan-binding domain